MNKPIAQSRSKSEIIELVRRIKKLIDYDDYGFPVIRFVECVIQTLDPDFSYDYVNKHEMPENTYAYYDPINNVMKIDEKVYCRALDGNPRDIFTIAHEIGHYFLVDKIVFARSNSENIPAYMNPEWQANTFAAELLMPSNKIRDMTVEEIMNKCNVSKTAATIALKNAKKPNRFYRQFDF